MIDDNRIIIIESRGEMHKAMLCSFGALFLAFLWPSLSSFADSHDYISTHV